MNKQEAALALVSNAASWLLTAKAEGFPINPADGAFKEETFAGEIPLKVDPFRSTETGAPAAQLVARLVPGSGDDQRIVSGPLPGSRLAPPHGDALLPLISWEPSRG